MGLPAVAEPHTVHLLPEPEPASRGSRRRCERESLSAWNQLKPWPEQATRPLV